MNTNAKMLSGHILFWVVIMLTYAVSEWGYRNSFMEAMVFEFLYLPVRLVAVYINWFVLIPRLLYKNRLIKYGSVLAVMLFLLAVGQRYFILYWGYPTFFPQWVTAPPKPLVFFKIIQVLVIIASPVAFSTGIKLFLDWYDQKNKTKQLAIEKQEAELKYLKAQINPHFLFNVLNNIYGLALEKSEKVPSLIAKLSDLLSYSLYESSMEKTSLGEEVRLTKDFIALEKERYEDRIKTQWNIHKNVNRDYSISPLLLMPLVENAFKHGVKESIDLTKIFITLKMEEEQLVFKVVNTISPNSFSDNTDGIGLSNLKKRLKLLYPDSHSLKTYKKNNEYIAILKLQNNGQH